MAELDFPERGPGPGRITNRAVAAALANLFKCIPAKVVKWDASKQQADVQPLINRVWVDEEDERQSAERQVVPGVPVVFMGGDAADGQVRLTFPISDGSSVPATIGVLLFADASIDKWLGSTGQAVDPVIDHAHSPSDGIFIPGLRPFGAPWQSCPTDHATLGYDMGVQIHFHIDHVTVADSEGAEDFVALAQKVLTELTTFAGIFNTHLHAVSGAATGVPQNPIATPVTYTPGSVAATQLKSK